VVGRNDTIEQYICSWPLPVGEPAIVQTAKRLGWKREELPAALPGFPDDGLVGIVAERRAQNGVVTLFGLVQPYAYVSKGEEVWIFVDHRLQAVWSNAVPPNVEQDLLRWLRTHLLGLPVGIAGRPLGTGTWASREELLEEICRVLPNARKILQSKRRAGGRSQGPQAEVAELLNVSQRTLQKNLKKFDLAWAEAQLAAEKRAH
jgi:hypothetical protein